MIAIWHRFLWQKIGTFFVGLVLGQKRSSFGNASAFENVVFHAGTASGHRGHLRFYEDHIDWEYYNGSSWIFNFRTAGEFNDTCACASACSTGAMRFGDINEEGSKIAELKNNKRAYHLLDAVGTKPNVVYQVKVRNIKETS